MNRRRARSSALFPLLAAAGALTLLPAGASGAAAGGAARAAPTLTAAGAPSAVVTLGTAHVPRVAPRLNASALPLVRAVRPITGGPTVLPVLARRVDATGERWLRVRLPGRPNGSTGWIRATATRPGTTRWSLRVDLTTRRLAVLLDGRAIRNFAVVVGKPTTPTPRGSFFVEEAVALPAGAQGGPYALALSARSEVLRHYQGGVGQVAIHGTYNISGTPGTAVSHGCVRLTEPALDWLVSRIGAGVPVTIG